ncbi:unnamed protein product [Malus baccata var. baccata]
MDLMASERVCYVHCNFCNTILAVSVPCNSSMNMVTVRCGHCANLLSVNIGGSLQSTTIPPHQDPQKQHLSSEDSNKNCGSSSSSSSSSKSNKFGHAFESLELHDQPRISPIRPPEKRQRVPSAYNRFINGHIFPTFTLD